MAKFGNLDLLTCSFCGKSQKQVKKLIAGPGVYICDECLDLCNEILSEEGPVGWPWQRLVGPAPQAATRRDRSGVKRAAGTEVEVRRVMKRHSLTPSEERLVLLRNGFRGGYPWTLESVAEELGITIEEAREIQASAFSKLGDVPSE